MLHVKIRISKIIILEIVWEIWKISSIYAAFVRLVFYSSLDRNAKATIENTLRLPHHWIGRLIVRLVKTAQCGAAMKWFGANDSTRASGTIRDGYIPLDWRLILNSPISRRSLINPFWTPRDDAWDIHLDTLWTILTRSHALYRIELSWNKRTNSLQ